MAASTEQTAAATVGNRGNRLETFGFTTLGVAEREDRLHLTLHRPEMRNAIDQVMVQELHAACAHLEANPKILIISGTPADPETGAKGVFASGADIAQLRERRRDDALAGINSTVFDRVAKLPMPVIAALEGYALGGGAELAYAADFRIGTPSLRLGNPEPGLGIMAAAGATWRLRELVGEPLAKYIHLCGTHPHRPGLPRRRAHHDARGAGGSARRRGRPGGPHRPAGPARGAHLQGCVPHPARGPPADRHARARDVLRVPGEVRQHAAVPRQKKVIMPAGAGTLAA